jgi:hypothetical protein
MEENTRGARRPPKPDRCRFRRIVNLFVPASPEIDVSGSYLQDTNKQVKPSLIADACLAVGVLGADFRAHLIDRYVALELKEYRRIFRNTDEAGQMDNISRRFAWFRRLLHTHELEHGRVFPSDWRVGWHLLAKFSEITRFVCGSVFRVCLLIHSI